MTRRERADGISKRIKQMMLESGMSYTSISRLTGIPLRSIQEYAVGVQPTGPVLSILCEKLGTSADWVLGLSDRRELDGPNRQA